MRAAPESCGRPAVAKLPKDERVWVSYKNKKGVTRFLITSKPTRDAYTLYEIIDGDPKRMGKSPSPGDLVEKFDVMKRVLESS